MTTRINDRGGSLRAPGQTSPEAKVPIRALVQGDPELQRLINEGPEPIEHLVERQAPPWESQEAANALPPEPKPFPDRFIVKPLMPEPPPAPSPKPESAEVPDEPADPMEPLKKYRCTYYWENDPRTFSAEAVLRGHISDVCLINPTLKVRYRSLAASERAEIDRYLPPLSNGMLSQEAIQNRKALIRLALSIETINDQPIGRTVPEAMSVLERFPEELVQVLSDTGLEFTMRVSLRLRGVQEALRKN